MHLCHVWVDVPQHARLTDGLTYLSSQPLTPGTLVRVPLGRRTVLGVVADSGTEAAGASGEDPPALKPVEEVWSPLAPLSTSWLRLVSFAAAYYQRHAGELALTALPLALRTLAAEQLLRRLKRLERSLSQGSRSSGKMGAEVRSAEPSVALVEAGSPDPEPTSDQAQVLDTLREKEPLPFLLYGVTGSGKTEVYLREAARVLAQGRQVLMLVPEINLTPQLEARVAARFPGRRLAVMHSGLTPPQRLQHWLAAHLGHADLVLGTRMAVFASLPRLGLIVVDEEHDPSYKQQEGARYSARDLAVYRARLEGVNVILGSATPSLETWFNAGAQGDGPGRYVRLDLPNRMGGGALPKVRLVDLNRVVAAHGRQALRESPFAPDLLEALRDRLQRGEQSLILLQRRGYAPVLHCTACGWKSACPHCSAWRVFHKADRSLRCHHCGSAQHVPRACPECGDPDIQPMGRGTERIEEQLGQLLPEARIARIDADTTRGVGRLEEHLAQVHEGDVDILVGTQMVAKGHDFRRMTLVAALQADAALFSSDFRAPERLFALLMQAGGRAGRDAALAGRSEMWIQTWNPEHPLFGALRRHDYEAFAASQLDERRQAGMPPFGAHALLRADARTQAAAHAFLQHAEQQAQVLQDEDLEVWGEVFIYAPVPATMQRVADVERAQMLIEAPRRGLLQAFLSQWLARLQASPELPRVIRWAVDVDPLTI